MVWPPGPHLKGHRPADSGLVTGDDPVKHISPVEPSTSQGTLEVLNADNSQ